MSKQTLKQSKVLHDYVDREPPTTAGKVENIGWIALAVLFVLVAAYAFSGWLLGQ